jgi:hypothetical protein
VKPFAGANGFTTTPAWLAEHASSGEPRMLLKAWTVSELDELSIKPRTPTPLPWASKPPTTGAPDSLRCQPNAARGQVDDRGCPRCSVGGAQNDVAIGAC